MAVHSSDMMIDPVGACVGQRGSRVDRVVEELKGEKIDIIKWSADPAEFVANALNPAHVLSVFVAEGEKACRVVVPDNQLSLAIGKEGQNARLAAKLTGWKIDIKSQSQAAALTDMVDEEAPEEAQPELPPVTSPFDGLEARCSCPARMRTTRCKASRRDWKKDEAQENSHAHVRGLP